MGCCLACHPLADVEQDPAVSLHTTVGDMVVFWGTAYLAKVQFCSGIMYVKEGHLYYETKCGSKLCCRCYKQCFKLSEIRSIDVVNKIEWYPTIRGYRHIALLPGLKIELDISSTNSWYQPSGKTNFLIAVPDAAVFAQKLLKACNLSS